jgi:hypothetical protein
LQTVLTNVLEPIVRNAQTARFTDRLVSADTVADIHGIHTDTVIRYAKARLIPHEMKGKLYKFSLAAALEFNFHDLRRKTTIEALGSQRGKPRAENAAPL